MGRDEHGGNYSCFITLNDFEKLPTQSLLQRWLREVHKIDITLISLNGKFLKSVRPRPSLVNSYNLNDLGTYEEVLEIALVEALNKIK